MDTHGAQRFFPAEVDRAGRATSSGKISSTSLKIHHILGGQTAA